MRVRYTAPAARELISILDYIETKNPQGAQKVLSRIREISTLLSVYAYAGRATSRVKMRALALTPYPYLVSYRVEGDEIVIYDIRHTSRGPGRSAPGTPPQRV